MTTEQKQQVLALLDANCKEFTPSDYIGTDETFSDFDELRELLDNNGAFNVEVIYYATAMEFLQKKDPSLNESLELAEVMGYTPKNINSEILASLLASEYARIEFEDIESEVTDLINSFDEEEETEEHNN
jgi:hypothetical protein